MGFYDLIFMKEGNLQSLNLRGKQMKGWTNSHNGGFLVLKTIIYY